MVWNTSGEGDPRPLEEFWAERFLVYPGDSKSGPLLRNSKNRKARARTRREDRQAKEIIYRI